MERRTHPLYGFTLPPSWKAHAAKDRSCGDLAIVAEENGKSLIIAECYEDIRSAYEGSQDEAAANARLFVTAPRLVERLEHSARVLASAHLKLQGATAVLISDEIRAIDELLDSLKGGV